MSVAELQSNVISGEIRGAQLLRPSSSDSSRGSSSGLREPKDLYSASALQHAAKWPIECQVIPERIRHIDKSPNKPEPFYNSNNLEPQPKPVGEEFGTIIYNYLPKLSVDYFCRSCPGGSGELQTFEADANTIKFESRFESGNLGKVIKITNVYYELYLRPDMYTDRNNSYWFYFRIQNMKENIVYRFSIVNLSKPDSLYKYGLKPLMYSEKDAQLHGIGWTRCGYNISYFRNDSTSEDSLYTLTFNIKFKHGNDTVYFAQCYPYTYTKLQSYLADLECDRSKSSICQQRLLCKSLAGNNVYVLTITSPENYLEATPKKAVIVLTARVHPAETQSSYMMKGIIDFLSSDSMHAQELRDRFIFKLIPMLNPDGVIVGNSRCCLLGQDLNRQYRTVLREAFPQIYHTKVMLRRLVEENGIFLYCDIHGHSRRNNVFIYGCENRRIPEKRLVEQIYPLMLHKNAADKFSFASCKFKIQRNKEGTGRVFAWTLGIVNSYTLEISLAGSTLSSRQHTHFNISDYEGIGRHFCETLLDFSDPNEEKEILRDKILQKLIENGSSAEEPINIPLSDYSSLSHSETESSDNEEEGEVGQLPKDVKTLSSKRPPLKRQLSLRSSKKKLKMLYNKEPFSARSKLKSFVGIDSTAPEIPNRRAKREIKELNKLMEETPIIVIDPPEIIQEVIVQEVEITTEEVLKPKKLTDLFISTQKAKCTNLLFDDPFNPPDVKSPRKMRNFDKKIWEDEDSAMNSEDECDGSDRICNSPNFLSNQFSLLNLSPSKKLNKIGVLDQIGQNLINNVEKNFKIKKPESSDISPQLSFKKLDHKRSSSRGREGEGSRNLMSSKKEVVEKSPNNANKSKVRPTSGGRRLSTSTNKNELKIPQNKGIGQLRRVSWAGPILNFPQTIVRPLSPCLNLFRKGSDHRGQGQGQGTSTTSSGRGESSKKGPGLQLRKWKSLGEKTETSSPNYRRSSLVLMTNGGYRIRPNGTSNDDLKKLDAPTTSNSGTVKSSSKKVKVKRTRSKKVSPN